MRREAANQAPQLVAPAQRAAGVLSQRRCACGTHTFAGGECNSCRKGRAPARLQRAAVNAGPVGRVPSIVREVLDSSGRPLDAEARSFFEMRFGHDFSHVRVHTDPLASESARAVRGLAYTVGSHIAVRKDAYAPGTSAGRRLLAHELAHVVQQSAGTGDRGGAEARADAAARRVMDGERVGPEVVGAAPLGLYRQHDESERGEGFVEDDDELLSHVRAHFARTHKREDTFPPIPPDSPLLMRQGMTGGRYFSMLQHQEAVRPQMRLDRLSKDASAGSTYTRKGLSAGYNPYNPYAKRKQYESEYLEKQNMTGKTPTEWDMVSDRLRAGAIDVAKIAGGYLSDRLNVPERLERFKRRLPGRKKKKKRHESPLD